jgi:hypothetical protein
MQMALLNRYLLPLGLEVLCENCVDRKESSLADQPTSPGKSASQSKHTQSSFFGRRIRKKAPLVTPPKRRRSPVNAGPKKQSKKQRKGKVAHDLGRADEQNNSPLSPCVLAPNFRLNLNHGASPTGSILDARPKPRFENTLYTPLKIGEVHFYSGKKLPKLPELDFKQHFCATAEARVRWPEDESAREFGFDRNDKNPHDSAFPVRNPPSCFQSPFMQTRPMFSNETPGRSVNFEKIVKSLDFLENPFFDDFN